MLRLGDAKGTAVKKKSIKAILADPEFRKKLDALVNPLKMAYQDAAENYRLEAGSDGRTAGLDIYTFGWHQIRESGAVKLTTTREPFWFELGQDAVACHRVSDKRSPIESSFPRDRSDWPTTVVRQRELDYGPKATGVSNNVLVLAHMGNPIDGLLAMFLCRPLIDEYGRLIEWLDVGLLWSAPASESQNAVPIEPPKAPARVSMSPKNGGKKPAKEPLTPLEHPKQPAKIILLKQKDRDGDAGE